MSEGWRSYRGAPDPGARLCDVATIPDPGTLALSVAGFPVLLVRRGDEVTGFVNACPHQYLPLDHKGAKVLSADGSVLRCTNHSAGFDATTGEGVEGLGLDCALDRIPLTVEAGAVLIRR